MSDEKVQCYKVDLPGEQCQAEQATKGISVGNQKLTEQLNDALELAANVHASYLEMIKKWTVAQCEIVRLRSILYEISEVARENPESWKIERLAAGVLRND